MEFEPNCRCRWERAARRQTYAAQTKLYLPKKNEWGEYHASQRRSLAMFMLQTKERNVFLSAQIKCECECNGCDGTDRGKERNTNSTTLCTNMPTIGSGAVECKLSVSYVRTQTELPYTRRLHKSIGRENPSLSTWIASTGNDWSKHKTHSKCLSRARAHTIHTLFFGSLLFFICPPILQNGSQFLLCRLTSNHSTNHTKKITRNIFIMSRPNSIIKKASQILVLHHRVLRELTTKAIHIEQNVRDNKVYANARVIALHHPDRNEWKRKRKKKRKMFETCIEKIFNLRGIPLICVQFCGKEKKDWNTLCRFQKKKQDEKTKNASFFNWRLCFFPSLKLKYPHVYFDNL